MVDATHIRFLASDRSYFQVIKKDVHLRAKTAGFDEKKLAEIDLIIAELTSNLHKYAADGEILAGFSEESGNGYLELISIDRGEGMNNPHKMIEDGISTSNTLGTGLGCIKRLSDKFDIYSLKGWGTIVLSRIYQKKPEPRTGVAALLDIRPLVVAMPGQDKSGDGSFYKITDQYFKLLVADGLGHGPEANHAVNEAVNAFRSCPYHSPAEILKHLHLSIKHTRGIVATVVVFDFLAKKWKIAGVGNITTRLSNFLDIKNQMSYNGIIGHNMPRFIDDQEVALEDYHQITLCSDGMNSRWEWNKFPGINRCDLSIQAAAIYKDFARQTDDMSVVMAKISLR
ncbi:SpoIIE family protein phosphatase [Pedobacter sp. L105]|uniref:SpoIIE family protein phosphatase n=1 Tax=Pedobacter sp. L105 TaxID=1641871 RepID=UPI00131A80D0|nr:SpoIIE family protein phosphatase [Pedobacter sp. L105]